MAKKDWKKVAEDAIEGVKDRVRELLGALEDALAPAPQPVRIPVRGRR